MNEKEMLRKDIRKLLKRLQQAPSVPEEEDSIQRNVYVQMYERIFQTILWRVMQLQEKVFGDSCISLLTREPLQEIDLNEESYLLHSIWRGFLHEQYVSDEWGSFEHFSQMQEAFYHPDGSDLEESEMDEDILSELQEELMEAYYQMPEATVSEYLRMYPESALTEHLEAFEEAAGAGSALDSMYVCFVAANYIDATGYCADGCYEGDTRYFPVLSALSRYMNAHDGMVSDSDLFSVAMQERVILGIDGSSPSGIYRTDASGELYFTGGVFFPNDGGYLFGCWTEMDEDIRFFLQLALCEMLAVLDFGEDSEFQERYRESVSNLKPEYARYQLTGTRMWSPTHRKDQ